MPTDHRQSPKHIYPMSSSTSNLNIDGETADPQYPLTSEQEEQQTEAFIQSIDPTAVCSLASRHNGSRPCRFFRDATRGSFNICFFVEFPENDEIGGDGDSAGAGLTRWVVRIPIAPRIENVWDKLQSEVATMA